MGKIFPAGCLLLLMAMTPLFALGLEEAEARDRARQAEQAGQSDLAIYYTRQAVQQQKAPTSLAPRVWLARAYLQRKNYLQAKDEAEAVLAMKSGHLGAKAVLAQVKAALEKDKPGLVAVAPVQQVKLPERKVRDLQLPRGRGAWVMDDMVAGIRDLNRHNAAAPESLQIRYAFVPAGELVVQNGKLHLAFDPLDAVRVAESMNFDVLVFPIVTVKGRGASRVPSQVWESMGADLASRLEKHHALGGLMFDLPAGGRDLLPLYAFTRQFTRLPVAASLKEWHALTFAYLDLAVLKAFDYGAPAANDGPRKKIHAGDVDLNVYAGSVSSSVTAFLKETRKQSCKALVGIPASATPSEFEKLEVQGRKPIETGIEMGNYEETAVHYVSKAVVINDVSYLGLAFWALRPKNGVRFEGVEGLHHPSNLSESFWDRIKMPLVGR